VAALTTGRGPRRLFGAKSMTAAAFRSLELDKWTHQCGRTWGIEWGGLAASLCQNRGEMGRRVGAWARRAKEIRGGGGVREMNVRGARGAAGGLPWMA
jgi:hypothetical protein